MGNVKGNIEAFLKLREPNNRYASFDYCFNYFRQFYKDNSIEQLATNANMQNSCLQIASYLASWGMYRGSSFLLKYKSITNFKGLIKGITEIDNRVWTIDVDKYDNSMIQLLLNTKKTIKDLLGNENNPSDTLVSKIMMGVFGCVPAFDQLFRRGMGIYTFNKKSLEVIANFYNSNKSDIDGFHIQTIDFTTEKSTKYIYTKAKLIDMVGFIEGGGKP
ncbi:MAG: hypothetical protein A2252_11655 [Elusimicrobia bacterium RIFOXYA2_FULL_39_19]|nr:MAG: hypothetical protein A2252_11655 [Elusimicrobia bacterium RIFOXYA2_FULL_39_19]